jgi:transposase
MFYSKNRMALQLLEHTKKAGEKIYRYYSIAEPYREDGKNKKRVLAHLGALDADQVQRIRQALRVHNDPGEEVYSADRIGCADSWRFLDLSVFHELWKEVDLGSVVEAGDGDIELGKLLETLVLNRITAPTSKLGVTRWYPGTALDRMIGIPVNAINESRMYRCLPGIADQQKRIEQHLFTKLVATGDPRVSSLYFYDLTSSYFEGSLVEQGAFSEHSKDHRPDRLQVMLGLLINEKGIPFSWDLLPGNQGEAPTLITQLKKFKTRFGIENALLVFDRGFLSHGNLHAVEAAGYHYLTGLRAPQIETLISIYPQKWMSDLNAENAEDLASKQKEWQRFDETGFYCPLGVVNERRTVLLFDASRYRLAIASRQSRIEAFKKWMYKHNAWLASFKKDAERTAIENDVNAEIARRKLDGFVACDLHEYITENEIFRRRKNNPYPSQGHISKVRSFQIVIKEETNRAALDGVFALITSPKSPLTEEEMLLAYRQKYLIENAFREMKSILKLRPWFVYKDEHVRAHYTICVLAYALERLLDIRLQDRNLKGDGWTLGMLKEQLARVRLIELTFGDKHRRQIVQKIPENLGDVLKSLGLQAALRPPKTS